MSAEVALAPTSAYVALGSNLGDRLEHLRDAVRRLGDTDGIEVVRSSRVFETAPVGPPQPSYLNAVIEVRTTLGPRRLLEAAQAVEQALGRVRTEHWGPRSIDVDILTFGRETIAEPDLQVPHPRMHERGFVLVPLAELDADPMLPGERRLSEIRLSPDVVFGVRPFAPPLPVS
jgi:2-amino-4-hydroxy-6-hydroxymethyldihydropteridine diphosphokinase